MSRSRRSSNRNRNGNRNGGGNGTDNERDFWGTSLPTDVEGAAMIDVPDPTAMVRSLGMPPLAGNRPISEHYFAAVYGKASGLAHALMAADQDAREPQPAENNN